MSPGTQREMDAWYAYLEAGTMRKAARLLGVHEVTVRRRIEALRDRYEVVSNVQLAIAIERERGAA